MDKIQQIADNLALARKPIDDDDLVTIIINNVGITYEALIISAQARDKPILYDDLVALLLSAEMRLKTQNTPPVEVTPTAMYAPRSSHTNGRGRGNGTIHGSNMRGKGCDRGFPFIFVKCSLYTSCQICKCSVHTVIDCYKRMNGDNEGMLPIENLLP